MVPIHQEARDLEPSKGDGRKQTGLNAKVRIEAREPIRWIAELWKDVSGLDSAE